MEVGSFLRKLQSCDAGEVGGSLVTIVHQRDVRHLAHNVYLDTWIYGAKHFLLLLDIGLYPEWSPSDLDCISLYLPNADVLSFALGKMPRSARQDHSDMRS